MAQYDENPETQLFSLSTMKHFATLLTLLRQKTHFAYIEWSQKITKTKKMIQLNQWNSSNFFYHLFNCYTVFIYSQSLLYKYLFMYSILTTGHLHVTWFHAISWLLATGNQLRELVMGDVEVIWGGHQLISSTKKIECIWEFKKQIHVYSCSINDTS